MKTFIWDIIKLPWEIYCILYKDDQDNKKDDIRKFKKGIDNCLKYEPYWFPHIRLGKIFHTKKTQLYWDRTWWPTDEDIEHYFKHKK